MTDNTQELYTVAEAASIWGITPQAVYKRMGRLRNQGFIVEQPGKRYITEEGINEYWDASQQVEQPNGEVAQPNSKVAQPVEQLTAQVEQLRAEVAQLQTTIEGLEGELQAAEKDLLAEQGRASTLQATIDAQQAHIDSLKTALDREQALHMASLQQRLPAPGKGFFAWLKGRKGTE